jgi:hypothetical protein
MNDIVECHSGSTCAERPTALTWQGERLIIAEILSQGRTPQVKWFRVRTEAGHLFELSLFEETSESLPNLVWQIRQL